MSFDVWAQLNQKKLYLIFLIASNQIFAEDITVITADRINSFSNKSSSDVRVINSEEITQSSSHNLPELLAHESDLNIVNSGQNGSSASLFLRGTDSSQTLVVIDGIVMNDPSNPNRQFDLGRLSLNNIENIEILKGSQGLGYGSNAIGGVIVITTKKAKSTKISGESFVDYGTFKTIHTGTNFQKKVSDNVGLSFGTDFLKTNGFSAADEKLNPNAEKDGDKHITLDFGSAIDLSKNTTIDTTLRYSHNIADLDKGGGAGNDDPNDQQVEEEIYSRIQLTKNWDSGNAQSKFAYNFSKHNRILKTLPDLVHPQSSIISTIGEMNTLSANHTYYISDGLTQNLNIDWQNENDQSGHSNQNLSGYLYHQYELENKIFNFGLRIDHNRYFDDHFTYKAASGYKLSSALLKLSYSTGFRAPSLNQLFDPTYGNRNLHPETSQGVELSLENKWSAELISTSTLFFTNIHDRLSYNPNTFININLGKAEIIGLEKKLSFDWMKTLNQSLAFTLLKTHDLNRGQKLARRPDLNIKNNLNLTLFDSHHITYEIAYMGKRDDVDNLGNPVKMNSYLLSHLNYRFKLNSQNEVYLKIKNIFNENYEEIYGFGNGGRAITLGASRSY